jgi:hypothetical protein
VTGTYRLIDVVDQRRLGIAPERHLTYPFVAVLATYGAGRRQLVEAAGEGVNVVVVLAIRKVV